MNTVLVERRTEVKTSNCFSGSISDYDDQQLLNYFRQRDHVQFFSLADADETQTDKIDALLDNCFEFVGERHPLPEPLNWLHNPSEDIEWHILLHKFYYAVGLGLRHTETGNPAYLYKWVDLTRSWIAQTPAGFIAADVTGRRVQNWIYAYYHFVHQHPENPIPADFHRQFLEALHTQVEYLCQNLHPARNHRTLELYAIFLTAVVFPEFSRARDWLDFSLQRIFDNILTDLLDDGVQCELSTDYHHIVLKNYLCIRRLAKLNHIDFPASIDDRLVRALEFSMYVHRPDGTIPSLSDGDSRSFTDLLGMGAKLYRREDMRFVASAGGQGTPPWHRSVSFEDSGYYILRSNWQADGETFQDARYLVFDCGPLGAGNHGHLDLLNIEISAFGRPLVVDPGRYSYCESGDTNWRVRFRGTAYHNTVQVDGLEQTRYLPGKHKYKIQGPAPQHQLLVNHHENDFDLLAGRASSTEYDVVHERYLFFIDQRYWVCLDNLIAGHLHHYDLRFHLDHRADGQVQVEAFQEGFCVHSPNLLLLSPDSHQGKPEIDSGYVSRLYGHKQAAPVVRYSCLAASTWLQTVLFPFKHAAPALGLSTFVPICHEYDYDSCEPVGLVIHHLETGYSDWCFVSPDLTTRLWCHSNWTLHGKYLFMRIDQAGDILRLHTDPGASFHFEQQAG